MSYDEEVVTAAQSLLKATLEIVESDGGYCEYTRSAEICARALLPLKRPDENHRQLKLPFDVIK